MLARVGLIPMLLAALASGAFAAEPVRVVVASTDAAAGAPVGAPVQLETRGNYVIAVQTDLLFDPRLIDLPATRNCVLNPEISDRAEGCDEFPPPPHLPCKLMQRSLATCPADGCPMLCLGGDNRGDPCTSVAQCPNGSCVSDPAFGNWRRMRALILSLANANPIPDGVLYTCTFRVAPDAIGTASILSRAVISGSSGRLPSESIDGQVRIVLTPPTSTPTPSPTPTPPPCEGDCDGDGSVTIDDLITGVRIALDEASPDLCPALDADSDGRVTVEELVEAVDNALHGCVP
jgi:hypothetical protein